MIYWRKEKPGFSLLEKGGEGKGGERRTDERKKERKENKEARIDPMLLD